MDPGTRQAGSESRRRLIKWLIVILIVGALVVALAGPFSAGILSWTLESGGLFAQRITLLMGIIGLVTLAPVTAAAVYLLRLARRTVVERRYPPQGFKLVQQALPIEDGPAIGRARALAILASLLLLAAAAAGYFLWRIWRLLLASGPVA